MMNEQNNFDKLPLTLWLPQGFDKNILRNFLIFYFCCKIIVIGVGPTFLAFSVLEIIFGVTGDPLVDNGSKEKIIDMIGRWCTYFNVSGFLSS